VSVSVSVSVSESVSVCVCAPFSQLTLKRAAAGHFPLPAPTLRRLAAAGHDSSLTVGSA